MGFSTAARALATRRRTSSTQRSLPFAYFSSKTSTQISCAGIGAGMAVDRSFAFILQLHGLVTREARPGGFLSMARLRSTGGVRAMRGYRARTLCQTWSGQGLNAPAASLHLPNLGSLRAR